MTDSEKDALIQRYAAGEVTWHALRTLGFASYLDVLAGLGRLGLRPPIAPLDGPNAEGRAHARALLRGALAAQGCSSLRQRLPDGSTDGSQR